MNFGKTRADEGLRQGGKRTALPYPSIIPALSQHALHHLTVDVGQPKVAARRRRTFHAQKNYAFCRGGKMRSLGSQWTVV